MTIWSSAEYNVNIIKISFFLLNLYAFYSICFPFRSKHILKRGQKTTLVWCSIILNHLRIILFYLVFIIYCFFFVMCLFLFRKKSLTHVSSNRSIFCFYINTFNLFTSFKNVPYSFLNKHFITSIVTSQWVFRNIRWYGILIMCSNLKIGIQFVCIFRF